MQKQQKKKQEPLKPRTVTVTGDPIPEKKPAGQMWLPVLWAKKALAVAGLAMSDDLLREHLCNVVLIVRSNELIARATQGHWLIDYRLPLPPGWKHQSPTMAIVPRATVKRLVRDLGELIKDEGGPEDTRIMSGTKAENFPPSERRPWDKRIKHPPAVVFDVKSGVARHGLGSSKIPTVSDDRFKNSSSLAVTFDRLLQPPPQPEQATREFGLNGRYLAEVTKAIKIVGGVYDQQSMCVKIAGPLDPIFISPVSWAGSALGEKLTIVVMPMKV